MNWIIYYPPGQGNRDIAEEILEDMKGLNEIPKEVEERIFNLNKALKDIHYKWEIIKE